MASRDRESTSSLQPGSHPFMTCTSSCTTDAAWLSLLQRCYLIEAVFNTAHKHTSAAYRLQCTAFMCWLGLLSSFSAFPNNKDSHERRTVDLGLKISAPLPQQCKIPQHELSEHLEPDL